MAARHLCSEAAAADAGLPAAAAAAAESALPEAVALSTSAVEAVEWVLSDAAALSVSADASCMQEAARCLPTLKVRKTIRCKAQ